MTPPAADPHRRHRFLARVIAHAAWLCHAFRLGLRDVEPVFAGPGAAASRAAVSRERVRRWCAKVGGASVDRPRRRRPRPGATWRLDGASARVAGGRRVYLWRAVDQRGAVLDTLVQARRDAATARRFLARLLERSGFAPRPLVTDGLRSYAAARCRTPPGAAHRQRRWLNNRAEESHRPVLRRERQMQRFKSAAQAQRFLSAHGVIRAYFGPARHRMAAADHRRARAEAFRIRRRETCVRAPARCHRQRRPAYLLSFRRPHCDKARATHDDARDLARGFSLVRLGGCARSERHERRETGAKDACSCRGQGSTLRLPTGAPRAAAAYYRVRPQAPLRRSRTLDGDRSPAGPPRLGSRHSFTG